MIVTVRSSEPRTRVDVVPVSYWNPPAAAVSAPAEPGAPVWIGGSVQRRFHAHDGGRRSRLEIVAHDMHYPPEAPAGATS